MNSRANLTLKSKSIKVGITFGDPSGIGPYIIAKALSRPGIRRLAEFFVIGDKWVFEKVQNSNRKAQNFKFINLANVARKNFAFGKLRAKYGKASVEYIDKAVELIKKKKIDCVVTAPISKQAIGLSGFKWPGHSEYLAYSSGTADIVMMLANRYVRVSLVTRHIPLKNVSGQLNRAKVYKTIVLTHRALRDWFSIKEPRIAVCALNPHAGDGGLLGREEKDVIGPAIKTAKKIIRYLKGPLPCDTVFSKAKEKVYDAVIAMYHDQAMLPLKVLGFASGVNITIGLPFVRTSPLHGTAFDIAADFSADSASMEEAIRCTLNQKTHSA
jgi:4-hydroxythreonine-4-phosphate dehydrogenase